MIALQARDEGRAQITALVQRAIVDEVFEQTRDGGEPCVRVEVLRGYLHDDFVRLHEGEGHDG